MKAIGVALAPAIEPNGPATEKKKAKVTGLALAPAIEPNGNGTREVRTPNRLARHRKNRRERQALAEEEKTEIVVDPVTKNFRATRVDEEDPQEELEDDYDSDAAPGAVRMGGNDEDDYTSAPSQAESLEVGLPPTAASSAALLLQAELAPDINEEIARAVSDMKEEMARAVIEERERGLRERNQNTVLATAVEVDEGVDVDEVVEVDDVEGKRWKIIIVTFLLFVIGMATALSMLFTRERSNPADPPTMIATDSPTTIPTDSPTMSRFSVMAHVIASSFQDDFPNSPLQESVLNWLANEDPATLAVDTDSTILLERYTAALFYFATQGDGWTFKTEWLTSTAVCSWSGLECNQQGFLATMDLGTCVISYICL
jgi:hypothetical protein